MRFMFPKNRQGFTLTEMAIVLGVIGMVISAIWVAAGAASNARKLSQAQRDLVLIVSNIRTLYAAHGMTTSGNFADLTPSLVNAGVFPKDMPIDAITTPGYPVHPWGGDIKVEAWGNCYNGPWTGGQCDNGSFEIEFYGGLDGWPKVPCAAFISGIIGPGRDPGLTAVFDSVDGWMNPATIVLSNISPNCTYVSLAYRIKV